MAVHKVIQISSTGAQSEYAGKSSSSGAGDSGEFIIADASGIHSPEAVKMMIDKGFKGSLANLSGGLVDWEHSGLPVVVDYTEKLSGQCACQLRARGKV